MINIPRGKYPGEAARRPLRARPSTSSVAQLAAAGLIAVISAKCSSTNGVTTPAAGSTAMTGAQGNVPTDVEISGAALLALSR
jgi:hypothetical protein